MVKRTYKVGDQFESGRKRRVREAGNQASHQRKRRTTEEREKEAGISEYKAFDEEL